GSVAKRGPARKFFAPECPRAATAEGGRAGRLLNRTSSSTCVGCPVLKMTRIARRLLRAALALCILVWLAHSVGLEHILQELEHASLPLLLAATALLALDGVAKARNWQQLLIASVDDAPALPLLRVMRWHFAGGFVGAVVPSSASTDA